jgi:hypothetical protein
VREIMNRTLQLPIASRDSGDQLVVVVEPTTEIVSQLALDLSLLKEGLTDSITLASTRTSLWLEVKCNPRTAKHERGEVSWQKNRAKVIITPSELDYWLHYFLKYYRDGQGEVDHIDVDITRVSGQSDSERGLFLVFKVPVAAPSVSADEAMRRLGAN